MTSPVTYRRINPCGEVGRRTVLRDVESLSGAGVPIYTVRGPGGGFALLDQGSPIPVAGPARHPARGRRPIRARARIAPEGATVAAVLGRLQPLRFRPDVVPDGDGRVEVSFRMHSVEHAAADVLSLGPLIEVLHPPELRERVAGLARATAALYDGSERPPQTSIRSEPGTTE